MHIQIITLPLPFMTLIFVWALLCSSRLSAEEFDLYSLELEELMQIEVTTATKMDAKLSTVPGAVSVVTRAQIEASGASTIADILRLVAGVDVRWNSMVQTITMRGFGQNPFTNRVLLLIDDVPYNSWNKGGFPQHPGLDFFVLQNIKQIEIMRGPSSALYGENAYWGVINIKTLSGGELDGAEAELLVGDRNTRRLRAIAGGTKDQWEYLVSAQRTRSQLGTELWTDNDASMDILNLYMKASNPNWTLSYYRYQDENDPFRYGVDGLGSFNSAETIEQTVDILALSYEKTLTSELAVDANLSYSARDGSHCGNCHAAPQSDRFNIGEDHGYQTFSDITFTLDHFADHTILVGAEGRRISSGDHDHELATLDEMVHQVMDEVVEYDKQAIYLQDEWRIIEDKLTATMGVRYDTSTSPALFSGHVSPRLAFVYRPQPEFIVRGGWSRAFHFPDFSMLYQDSWFINFEDDVLAESTIYIPAYFEPNANLAPEQIDAWDLGFEMLLDKDWSLKIKTFWSKVTDFHVLMMQLLETPERPVIYWDNHPDQANIFGAEFELRWTLDKKISGFANWSIQRQQRRKGIPDQLGLPMEFVYAPENHINLGFYYSPTANVTTNVEVSWKDQYVAPQRWYLVTSGYTDSTVRPFDSYALLNARWTYKLPWLMESGDRRLALSLQANNLLDETPCETLVGVGCERVGREFYMSLKYSYRNQ